MSEEKSKIGWPRIVAVFIGLPLLYVASFGTACWIAVTTQIDDMNVFPTIYWPLGSPLYQDIPVVSGVLADYVWVCTREGDQIRIAGHIMPPEQMFPFPRPAEAQPVGVGAPAPLNDK